MTRALIRTNVGASARCASALVVDGARIVIVARRASAHHAGRTTGAVEARFERADVAIDVANRRRCRRRRRRRRARRRRRRRASDARHVVAVLRIRLAVGQAARRAEAARNAARLLVDVAAAFAQTAVVRTAALAPLARVGQVAASRATGAVCRTTVSRRHRSWN